MIVPQPSVPAFDAVSAAPLIADLGFLSSPDLPDRPGPAYLLVALREIPTLHHYDPESVQYWVSAEGRGTRRVLTRQTSMPIDAEFSWGMIRIVDRLRVTNEYLTFGGRLSSATIEDTVVAAFTSPAPILRRGGHSQGWDHGAECLGGFFARLLRAVDYEAGFEARLARTDPVTRYASFVDDTMTRFRATPSLPALHPALWTLLRGEEQRLRTTLPVEWAAGQALRADAFR